MVELSVAGDRLVVAVRGADALWSFRRRIEVPLNGIADVRVFDNLRTFLSVKENRLGLRLPGTALPGVIVAGSYRRRGRWTFCCARWRRPILVIDLAPEAGKFDRLVLGVADPERARQDIDTARGHRPAARRSS